MKKFVPEYGRLIIAIIALIGFFTLLGVILSKNITNPKSIYGVFNVHAQDSSSVYDGEFYESVIGDVVESNTAPYFKISNNPNFVILENQIDWHRLFYMQIGKLKAECSVNYIKNRVGTDINASGKSKIVFNYN